MIIGTKLLCYYDAVRFISEKTLKREDGSFLTLSVTDGGAKEVYELKIFLGRDDAGTGYEVKVYKHEKNGTYVPHETDRVDHYEENDEYAAFFFTDFDKAISFVDLLGYVHPEYTWRPSEKITIESEN